MDIRLDSSLCVIFGFSRNASMIFFRTSLS